jgi:HAD superfamily hydrolase (TIGR01459 family)
VTNTSRPAFVSGLKDLAPLYGALLCDVWGVLHNGVGAFPEAVEALVRFRTGGGSVALLTNAPRPKAYVVDQLLLLGVPNDAHDDVVTSGEAARDVLAKRPGVRVLHLGPDRDLPLYDGLDLVLAGEGDCDLISCTGLVDDTVETPEDYADDLRGWRDRGLPMLCVNPDIVVERGGDMVWCAGALAERYRALGGATEVVGKPHPAIYRTALTRLRALAGSGGRDAASVLAVGDGIDTDVRGAFNQGLDVAFVTGGIHAVVFGDRTRPDIAAVHGMLAAAGLGARALMTRLAWDG